MRQHLSGHMGGMCNEAVHIHVRSALSLKACKDGVIKYRSPPCEYQSYGMKA